MGLLGKLQPEVYEFMTVRVPIVVFAGQSNANNTGSIAAIFDRVAANNGLMVQAAVNGSPLASNRSGPDWSAGTTTGELLTGLFNLIDPLLNPNSPSYVPGAYLDTVIWSQGGADVFSKGSAAAYQANLTQLITTLQARYNMPEFVISGLADSSLAGRGLTGQMAQNWQMVKAAQQAVTTLPHVTLVNPDAVAAKAGMAATQMYAADFIHYKDGFGTALGTALANSVLSGASSAANSNYRAGTTGADSFSVTPQGMMQIYGNDGMDSVTLNAAGKGVLLQDQGFTTTHVTDRSNDGSFHLNLISIETATLTNAGDEARLNGVITSLFTLGGNDKVMGSGAAESVNLGDGSDYAAMMGGNDTIDGGAGSDTILGGGGDDRLFGGAGADRLQGGAGLDLLTGGAGADQFIFDAWSGQDRITDFQNGLDKLAITGATWATIRVASVGTTTEISYLDGKVILENTAANLIDPSDFIFQ